MRESTRDPWRSVRTDDDPDSNDQSDTRKGLAPLMVTLRPPQVYTAWSRQSLMRERFGDE
jgi:hypothetical protein